jgi:ribosomal protein S12 methylthiotransferase
MKKQLSNWTKQRRFKKIKKLQAGIVFEKAKENMGKVFKVLIDYFDENRGIYVGHSEFLSPTVDFAVEIEDNINIETGKFVDVQFVGFDGENYKGVYYESSK